MSSSEIVDALAAFPLFQAVPRPQLEWLVAVSEVQELADCERLYMPEAPIVHMHIVLRGALHIFDIRTPSQDIWRVEPGNVTGYLPFSRIMKAAAVTEAAQPTTMLSWSKAHTQELAANYFELTQALVGVMTARVREIAAQQQQNEKMMALGKLSAGLAHELNNPIAAIASTADYLGRYAHALPDRMQELLASGATAEQVKTANSLFQTKPDAPVLSQFARGNLEEELFDWLDENQVPEAAELAETLAERGTRLTELEALGRHTPVAQLGPLLHSANDCRQLIQLVGDAREASGRVTELIKSIKIYTHMDQSPVKEPTDIHEGLRNTMVLLGHKFRSGNVELVQELDATMPDINLLVGKMNQVWTNLLDNALDAVEKQPNPALHVRTSHGKGFARVQITDNGTGIPDEVKKRIFDPFFTTKEPGKGTGMGLDVVLRIVRQHNGNVTVDSEPGRTTFEVCIPIQ